MPGGSLKRLESRSIRHRWHTFLACMSPDSDTCYPVTSETRIELSSNSKPTGEASSTPSAQFPWKWQRNSSNPLRLVFFCSALLPPFFPLFFSEHARCDERDRIDHIHSACPVAILRFFRSFHEFSFARLPCAVWSAENSMSVTISR